MTGPVVGAVAALGLSFEAWLVIGGNIFGLIVVGVIVYQYYQLDSETDSGTGGETDEE
ncbi:MAG: hypothetical protein J07HX5_00521 [halophilic archaeon J07HX5]|jgi:hypothetical protein|nr:MAG: hypothetical protein J07HX5_00521 [halophilic archaeon J07HX5]